jgi:alkylation response protein AidB-like acyl-CoA dehydrogenase
MRRTIFDEDHDLYRRAVRELIEKEITPHHDEWEAAGVVSREAWLSAGAGGHLCHSVAEEYGGAVVRPPHRIYAVFWHMDIDSQPAHLLGRSRSRSKPSSSHNS